MKLTTTRTNVRRRSRASGSLAAALTLVHLAAIPTALASTDSTGTPTGPTGPSDTDRPDRPDREHFVDHGHRPDHFTRLAAATEVAPDRCADDAAPMCRRSASLVYDPLGNDLVMVFG